MTAAVRPLGGSGLPTSGLSASGLSASGLSASGLSASGLSASGLSASGRFVTLAAAHGDRPVFAVDTPVGRVVVKRYADDRGAGVFATMTALWSSPFGAGRRPAGLPEPLRYVSGERLLVMEHVEGPAAGARGDLGATARVTEEAAGLLAELHGSGVVPTRARDWPRLLRSLARKAAVMHEPVGVAFARVLADLTALPVPDGALVCAHGDFSPRNLLCSPTGLRLIDFDRAQAADPLRDVAYWGCWAWTTLLLAGSRPSWEIGEAFLDAYAGHRSVGPVRARLAAHRAAGLLRIAHGWSALRTRPDVALEVVEEARRAVGGVGRAPH